MVEVREVKTKKEQKEFLNFPLDMYAGNPCFVPPLYGDEKMIFRDDYVYYDTCEAVYYNAYRDGKMVGRISGILQKASNEKRNERRIRFTRFDSINDIEVAKSLFDAVETWGKNKGMDTICGPLGFSDLEREGLLVEGFDELSTFEEQYNADYYEDLILKLGFEKEAEWTESKIYRPDEPDDTLEKMTQFILKRYNLRYGEAKNIGDYLDRYADQIFDLLDRAYDKIYGTVPFTDGMKKMLIDNFKLIINIKNTAVILDENGKVVCFGLCMPSIAKAVQKSRGHFTPMTLIKILRSIKRPEILDLALVGVEPEYENRGISTAISAGLMKMLGEKGVKYAETNLNLVDNYNIQNAWKRFKAVQHKRRRAYVKKMTDTEQ